jgi:hypothetical protein
MPGRRSALEAVIRASTSSVAWSAKDRSSVRPATRKSAAEASAAGLFEITLTLAATTTGRVKLTSESADSIDPKQAPKPDRPWHIVAGPELTTSQFDCATVPDGPDCRWEGGSWQRIEAHNKAMLREQFRKKAAECLIQPHHPPVNILGGYKFPDAPAVDLTPIDPACIPTATLYPDPGRDPLEIPDFLRRRLPRPGRDSNSDQLAGSADRLAA